MLNTDFPSWPAFTQEEADAVSKVLLSNAVNYWTGSECRKFEDEFAKWAGCRFAVAVSNGTVALEAALHAIDIGAGDEVIVTPRTFVASASCIALAGATPVFADIDSQTQNITAETIAKVVTSKTKAIVCVHLAGMPCDMDPIMRLAEKANLFVIEDCAQAHGARYKGRSVGSIGDIGAWSFCQDKIMTTGGEGGMLTTSDERLWSKMWSYKDHGKSWPAVYEREHAPGFRWLHESFGTNGRMLEMQATIGRIQLQRLRKWTETRFGYATQIWECARGLPGLRAPMIPSWAEHASYKCYVFVEPGELAQGWTRDKIMQTLVERGVPCYSGSCSEIYLEKAFGKNKHYLEQRLPVARELGETSLMFLVHPTMETTHIEKTCHELGRVMNLATSNTHS